MTPSCHWLISSRNNSKASDLYSFEGIALRHAAPANDLTQVVEGHEMLAPQVIKRLQDDLFFDVPHDVRRVALDALRIGVLGRLVEPGRDFLVGDALLLRPCVDREIQAQLVQDLAF